MLRPPRIVCTLLSGLLVFMLILILPQSAANAAIQTKYSATDGFTSDSAKDTPIPLFQIGPDCTGDAWWKSEFNDETGLVRHYVKYTANCKDRFAFNSPRKTRLATFKGINAIGAECNLAGIAAYGTTSSGGWSESGTVSMGYEVDPGWTGATPLVPGLGGLCIPTRITTVEPLGPDSKWSAPLTMPARPTFTSYAPVTACVFGTPGGSPSYGVNVVGSLRTHSITLPMAVNATGGGSWRVQFRWQMAGGSYQINDQPMTGTSTLTATSASVASTNTLYSTNVYFRPTSNPRSPSTTVSPFPNGYNDSFTNGGTVTGGLPVKVFGWAKTSEPYCAFYFGSRPAADVPTDTEDDPWAGPPPATIGTTTEPTPGEPLPPDQPDPAAPDPACDFDVLDPTSWLEGGMCAVVGLLGKIMNALLSLVSLVANLPAALLAAIGDLFVPDQAALNATGESMKDAWQESSVGQFGEDFAAVPEAFNPSGTSCSGPTIPIHQAGVNINWKPLDTCSGTGATVAGFARAAITISVLIGTAYAVLRLLGAALGLNLNGIGGKGD